MTSIIKQFNAHGLKYTFASSRSETGHEKDYGISKDKTFYSYMDNPNNYWQITFSQPVTAGSYQFRPYRGPAPDYDYVTYWDVSISSGSSLSFVQKDLLPSRPSGAAKFSFPKPISFKTFRITTSDGFLSVGEFDLFGQVGAINRATINYGLSKTENN